MNDLERYACSICGEESLSPSGWFLVAESRWEDKLQILDWHDGLAAQEGVHHACTAAHVQELVIHWMTTGSLDYPFAKTTPWDGPLRRRSDSWAPLSQIDLGAIRPITELSVHRESMRRLLAEAPESLKGILKALCSALEPRSLPEQASTHPEEGILTTKALEV